MTTRTIPVLLAALLLFSGCNRRLRWDYRDDPYLGQYAAMGEAECIRRLDSVYDDDRIVALRVLAEISADYRRKGDVDEAERVVGLILKRYEREPSQAVRRSVVALCLPVCGVGSERTKDFLRGRLAAGEFAGEAALALAALSPEGVFEDLEPLTRHPSADIRYRGAVALTVVGDARGVEGVRRVLLDMESGDGWPKRIDGMSLSEARSGLETRANRAFGPVW